MRREREEERGDPEGLEPHAAVLDALSGECVQCKYIHVACSLCTGERGQVKKPRGEEEEEASEEHILARGEISCGRAMKREAREQRGSCVYVHVPRAVHIAHAIYICGRRGE